MKAAIGTAATVAAIPAVSTTAAAHFPQELAIDIAPDGERNRIEPDENGRVSVAVLHTEFEDEDGETVVFDPTDRAVRYRFGTPEILGNGGGVRPIDDGDSSDVSDVNGDGNDDFVLEFPLDGAGFTGDESTGTLFWERDDSGEHGYAGTDDITLPDDMAISDIDVLNYALTLEHLEHAFYRDGLASSGGTFSEHDIEWSSIARYFDRPTLRYSVYQQLEDIRDHEKAHVEKLTQTIIDLGGNPVEEADYEFDYDTFAEFVAIAARLEDVGVSAYAGAAPLLSDPALVPPALSIHSVEARHASFLDTLNLRRAAPDAFDAARSMEQVLPIAEEFVASE